MRTHEAVTLRAEHAGQSVTLTGWVARRRDHGGVIFIDLRDASGVAQVVFREGEMAERAHKLRSEFVIEVVGEEARLRHRYLDLRRSGPAKAMRLRSEANRMAMLLGGYDSIREVIAFPKSGGGYDPLTAAPAPITTQQRKGAGVDFKPAPAAASDQAAR